MYPNFSGIIYARNHQDVYYINFPDDKLWQKCLGQYPQRLAYMYMSVLMVHSIWVLYLRGSSDGYDRCRLIFLVRLVLIALYILQR